MNLLTLLCGVSLTGRTFNGSRDAFFCPILHPSVGSGIQLYSGIDYRLEWFWATGLDLKWAVWGTSAFEVQVRGVTLKYKFIPNPFNSDWIASASEWAQGVHGLDGSHFIGTLSLYVRSNSGAKVRHTGKFTGKGTININF